jgi:uncharacterized protein (DUF433 family)
MTVSMDGHIMIDDRGIARIGATRSRVVDVVLDRRINGWSPEQIHEQYPHLSLAQIHAALAYYYDHQAELDVKIEQERQRADELRAAAGESPVLKRLMSQRR